MTDFKKALLLSPKGKIVVFSLVVLSFFALSFLDFSAPQGFVDARKVAPASLIKKAISENYFSAAAGANGTIHPKVLKLDAENQLYVFDFNAADLCGLGGCLYAVYTRDGTKVLSLYLRSVASSGVEREHSSSSVQLFSADGMQNHFPCLAIVQPDSKNRVVKTRYCYQGGTLTPVFQQLLESKQ